MQDASIFNSGSENFLVDKRRDESGVKIFSETLKPYRMEFIRRQMDRKIEL